MLRTARLASLVASISTLAALALPAHASPVSAPSGGASASPPVPAPTPTIESAPETEISRDPFARHLGGGRTVSGLAAHRAIHFTFDDGPSEHTPALLDVLEARGVRGTFFLVARQLEHERGRRIAREIAARGHTIGLHSYRHDDLTTLEQAALRRDLDRSERIFEDVFEARPWLFRPPYGRHDAEVDMELASRGYTQVTWNVTAHEGRAHTAEDVVHGFRAALDRQERMPRGPGGIVVFHDTHRSVIDAMPAIFDELDARNCALLASGEELWDVHADLSAWHEPRRGTPATRFARRMQMSEEALLERQALVRDRAARVCVSPAG